jgi:hypothetical protein
MIPATTACGNGWSLQLPANEFVAWGRLLRHSTDFLKNNLEEEMKKVLFALMLVTPALVLAEKPPPNPADYTVAIHVQSSRLVVNCSDSTNGNSVCGWAQHLTVLINGKKYSLASGFTTEDLLRVGDYKARILKEETKHTYEYLRTYESLFADGTTRNYYVAEETE